jgi:uncharacterized protein (TIGR03437 family)
MARRLLPLGLLVSQMLGVAGPLITNALPNPINAGGPYFPLMIFGTGFVPGSAVAASGTGLTTTFWGPTELEAEVTPQLRATSGGLGVVVINPDQTVSNTYTIIISPVIGTVAPAAVLVGSPGATITVTGLGLTAHDLLVLATPTQDFLLATTFMNSTTLIGTIPASLLAAPQAATIQIWDAITQGVSAVQAFDIQAPPLIASVSANPINVGGPPFQMTLFGSGFMPNSVVNWAGTPIGTTYLSANQIQAAITEDLRSVSGTFNLTVMDPGLATSPAFAIVVSPVLGAINPVSVAAGSPATSLTATGLGFTSHNSLVFAVSGQQFQLATIWVNAQTLTATIPAGALQNAASATVQVMDSGGGRSLSLPFTITPATAQPATTITGIVNAASSLPSIAPGSLVSIYGANLASSAAASSTFPLPTSLNGTSVTINGTSAPLAYVSPGQINAQVPYEIQAGNAALVVQSGAGKNAPVSFSVSATGPGVFVTAGGQAIAQNFPGYASNSSQNPVQPGQYLIVYLTGQGSVNPAVATGAAAPADPPALPLAPVQAQIGGANAVITFAGLAPGFAGLLQANLIVPEVPAGEQPLDISIGGVPANQAFVYVSADAGTGSSE